MPKFVIVTMVLSFLVISVLHYLQMKREKKDDELLTKWADGLVGSIIRGRNVHYEFPRYRFHAAVRKLREYQGVTTSVAEEGVIVRWQDREKFLPYLPFVEKRFPWFP